MVSRSVSFTLMHDWPSEVFGALDVVVVHSSAAWATAYYTSSTCMQHSSLCA